MNNVLFSSVKEDWETPQYLFDIFNKLYHFDIDICASADNAKCDRYFTKSDDALSKEWDFNSIWCNPPYGRKIIDWIRKAYFSHIQYNNTIVMLLPSRTDTVWFHNYIYEKADIIHFIKGRLKFSNSKNFAPFPSMIVIFRGKKR